VAEYAGFIRLTRIGRGGCEMLPGWWFVFHQRARGNNDAGVVANSPGGATGILQCSARDCTPERANIADSAAVPYAYKLTITRDSRRDARSHTTPQVSASIIHVDFLGLAFQNCHKLFALKLHTSPSDCPVEAPNMA
jgi:hypothetical protein